MLEVPSVHEAITRPLVKKITDVVLDNFGFRHDNTQFVFNGLGDTLVMNNSTIHDGDVRNNRMQSDQRIEVEFDEEIQNPTNIAIMRQEHVPVFKDRELNIWLRPVYVQSKLSLDFKLICRDQTTATMWKRRAELQSYRQMHTFFFDVDYHYQVPLGFLKQLWVIYTLMERGVLPPEVPFGRWLQERFTKRMSTVSNQSGKNTRVVIAEKQARIQGLFDFQFDVAKISKEHDSGVWGTQFSVTVYFDRVDGMVMDYPLVVHNQLIPKEYREDIRQNSVYPYAEGKYVMGRSVSLSDAKRFEGDNIAAKKPETLTYGVPIPWFDDWLPTEIAPHHVNISRILLQVDMQDRYHVITFDEQTLDEYSIRTIVLEYLKRCGSHALKVYDCIFNITLQEWWSVISDKEININETLMVTTKFELNPTKMYHLNIDLLDDLSYLSPLGRKLLSGFPELIKDWITLFKPDHKDKDLPYNKDKTVDMNTLIEGFDKDGGWWDSAGRLVNPLEQYHYNGKLGISFLNQFNIFAYVDGERQHGDNDRIKELDESAERT